MEQKETGLEKDYTIYDADGDFKPYIFSKKLVDTYSFLSFKDNERIYRYERGIYKDDGIDVIRRELVEELRDDYSSHTKEKVCDIVRGLTSTDRELFGEPAELINVENGVYDIKNDELLPHGPDKMFMSKIPVRYDPDASTDQIEKFVSDVVHDEDVNLIQEMFGYLLYRDYTFNKAFMLLGDGSNGKTTLTNIMEQFLGTDNVSNESLQDLISDPHAKARLHSKLLNVDADISDNELKKTGPFKKLTGTDSISAHRKYEKGFKFTNHAKLVFAANNLPRTRDTSLGFFRRWILIDFPYTFTDDPEDGHKDKDPEMVDKLTSDEALSGILNWAIKGLQRLLEKEQFSTDGAASDTKNKWIMQSDTLAAFVDRCVSTKAGSKIKCSKFFEHYSRFCKENGMTPHDDRTVGKRLQKLIPKARKERKMIDGERDYYYMNVVVESKRKDDVVAFVEENDDGDGVLIEDIMKNTYIEDVESVIDDLLNKGKLFEPEPDRVKIL